MNSFGNVYGDFNSMAIGTGALAQSPMSQMSVFNAFDPSLFRQADSQIQPIIQELRNVRDLFEEGALAGDTEPKHAWDTIDAAISELNNYKNTNWQPRY